MYSREGNLAAAEAYSIRHAYGGHCEEDEDDETDNEEYKNQVAAATPNTKRRLKDEHDLEKTGKIGPLKTFFTLIKGFVAAGILFLPKGWCNGGWLFST